MLQLTISISKWKKHNEFNIDYQSNDFSTITCITKKPYVFI